MINLIILQNTKPRKEPVTFEKTPLQESVEEMMRNADLEYGMKMMACPPHPMFSEPPLPERRHE